MTSCTICKNGSFSCICPECPICGLEGNHDCYAYHIVLSHITIHIQTYPTSHNDSIFLYYDNVPRKELLLSSHRQRRIKLLVDYGVLYAGVEEPADIHGTIVISYALRCPEFFYQQYLNVHIMPGDYHTMGGTGGRPFDMYVPGAYDFRTSLVWKLRNFLRV